MMDFLNALVALSNYVLIPGNLRVSNFAHGNAMAIGAIITALLFAQSAIAAEEKTITCTFTQECARHLSCKSIDEFTYVMRGFTGEHWLVELPNGKRLEVEMRDNPAQYLRDHEVVAWAEPHADGTTHDTVMMLADDLKVVLTDMTKSEDGKFTVDSPRFLGTCEVRGA